MIYNLTITGPIGVGKTTTIRELSLKLSALEQFKLNLIPEYIDGDDSMLASMMLRGYLSDPQTVEDVVFQNYIIRYYELIYEKIIKQATSDIINIYERIPSDSLLIFANKANRNGKLSNSAYKELFNRVMKLDTKYSTPNYVLSNYEYSTIISDDKVVSNIYEIIQNDLRKGENMNRIIFLEADYQTCFTRMQLRGRVEEKTYNRESIIENCNFYENIVKYISSKEIETITPENSYNILT